MAFTDPQVLTINAVPVDLNKVRVEATKTVYSSADEEVKLTLSHQESKMRTRRMARIDKRVVAADPLTSENEFKSTGVYIVIDEPEFGFSDTDLDHVVQALTAWLTTENVMKLLSSQH